jgi:hypothetical protein
MHRAVCGGVRSLAATKMVQPHGRCHMPEERDPLELNTPSQRGAVHVGEAWVTSPPGSPLSKGNEPTRPKPLTKASHSTQQLDASPVPAHRKTEATSAGCQASTGLLIYGAAQVTSKFSSPIPAVPPWINPFERRSGVVGGPFEGSIRV